MTLRRIVLFVIFGLLALGFSGCKNVCEKGKEMAIACTESWCEAHGDSPICADLDQAKQNAEAAFAECDERAKTISEQLTGEDGCIPWHDYLDAAAAAQSE